MSTIKKIIQKWGNCLVTVWDKTDRKIHDLDEGDIVELDVVDVEKKKKG